MPNLVSRFNSLYDAGHTVVGVEVAEQALRDFFSENNMEYTFEKVNKSNACVYKVCYKETFPPSKFKKESAKERKLRCAYAYSSLKLLFNYRVPMNEYDCIAWICMTSQGTNLQQRNGNASNT